VLLEEPEGLCDMLYATRTVNCRLRIMGFVDPTGKAPDGPDARKVIADMFPGGAIGSVSTKTVTSKAGKGDLTAAVIDEGRAHAAVLSWSRAMPDDKGRLWYQIRAASPAGMQTVPVEMCRKLFDSARKVDFVSPYQALSSQPTVEVGGPEQRMLMRIPAGFVPLTDTTYPASLNDEGVRIHLQGPWHVRGLGRSKDSSTVLTASLADMTGGYSPTLTVQIDAEPVSDVPDVSGQAYRQQAVAALEKLFRSYQPKLVDQRAITFGGRKACRIELSATVAGEKLIIIEEHVFDKGRKMVVTITYPYAGAKIARDLAVATARTAEWLK
jgi:hypothetical protein